VFAVDGNINVKEWTGVHRSLEVSLHKDITCWVNKLQLGNLQNKECITMHRNACTCHEDHYEIHLGITT
jgi:hypothetical protein